MAKMGRPVKLTPALQEEFLNALRRSQYVEVACDVVGINRRTMQRWLKLGARAARGLYHEFCRAVKKVQAERVADKVERINIDPSWQAAAWYLERRRPELWGANRAEIALLRKRLEALEKSEKSRGNVADNPGATQAGGTPGTPPPRPDGG